MSLQDDLSGYYIEVPLETDEFTLADDAIDVLQGEWADWEPNDGDLEVIQIEALAAIAAPVVAAASVATEEVFRTFGTKLVGVPYEGGTPATTTVTFALTDSAEHTVPDGSELDIDGVPFFTVGDATNAVAANAIPGVPVEAAEVGTQGNGLGETASRISALSFVAGVTADAPTVGGTDAMDDADYLGYLSRKLQLRADTIVTQRDHEYWALSWPGVGRAYATHTADRHVTVYITDDAGETVTAPVKAEMEADILNYRLVNTVTDLEDATYTAVTVTYTVRALPGYDLLDLEARIDAMLASWLSPTGFGSPKYGDPGVPGLMSWIGTNVVRRNTAIDRIADVEGVDYVEDVTLAGGTVDGAGNVTLPGVIALPRCNPPDGTVIGPA